MSKTIKTLSEFNEKFKTYKTFYFTSETEQGLYAMEQLSVVVVSDDFFNELIKGAKEAEIAVNKEMLEKRLKTSKFRRMPPNSIDIFIEKLNLIIKEKKLILRE